MRAQVFVTLKDGILDPQGVAVAKALESLGYGGVSDVRVGKLIDLDIGEVSEADAPGVVEEMCDRILSNPVIEKYTYEISG